MYEYFVSYVISGFMTTDFNGCKMRTEKKITSMEDVQKLVKDLETQISDEFFTVKLLSFTLLNYKESE